MKPVNIGGHSAYQDRVLTQLRKYYPNAASLSSSTWQIIDKFWKLNLSQVDELMKDRYSVFGPAPRLPYFHRQLWLSSDKNLTNAVHPPKVKHQKPTGKEQKAAPVEKLTVDDLFQQFEKNPPADMAPCAKLWEIFNTFFFRILPAWGLSL